MINKILEFNIYDVEVFKFNLKELFESGDNDVLKLSVKLKTLQNAIDDVLNSPVVEEILINEFDKQGEKDVKVMDCKISKREVGVKYDFAVDERWCLINNDVETEKQKLKTREEYLKNIKDSSTLINKDTGEMVELNPIPKTSKTKVIFTLKK
jgi:hypothetical protein